MLAIPAVLLAAVAFMVWAFASMNARGRREEAQLTALAAALGGTYTPYHVHVTRDGLAVSCHFTSTGGKVMHPLTHVEVAVPRGYPLVLDVARDTIQGAPADVVARLFDPEVRGYLLAHATARLATVEQHGDRVLRLALDRWLTDPPETTAAIATVARIAHRIRTAFADADRELVTERPDAYRPELDDAAARAAAERRVREVAAFEAARAQHDARVRRALWLVFVVLMLAVVGVTIAAH